MAEAKESAKEYRAKLNFWHNCKHYPVGKAFAGADAEKLLAQGLIEEGKGHNKPSPVEAMHRKPGKLSKEA